MFCMQFPSPCGVCVAVMGDANRVNLVAPQARLFGINVIKRSIKSGRYAKFVIEARYGEIIVTLIFGIVVLERLIKFIAVKFLAHRE
jgi:hypothetical protein